MTDTYFACVTYASVIFASLANLPPERVTPSIYDLFMQKELELLAERAGHRCAFELASRHGLNVTTGAPQACRLGKRIFLPNDLPPQRRQGLLAHEVAHFLLDKNELPNTERNANYLGGALLASRTWMATATEVSGGNVPRLAELHGNASQSLLAVRIAQLWGGRASSWQHGNLRWAIGGASSRVQRMSSMVRECTRNRYGKKIGDPREEPWRHVWYRGDGWALALEVPTPIREWPSGETHRSKPSERP